uniref:Ig-like domain-containing protein n=1 Tax=Gouania willdenowi TaxID=441366 RepID=A0A8C5HIW0_GOUWI
MNTIIITVNDGVFVFLHVSAQETCQSSSSSLHQERRLISVNVGDSVTLQCSYQKNDVDTSFFFWYKQPLRQEPKLISTQFAFDRNGTFHDEFKDEIRFTLKNEKHSLILTISDVNFSDSATYYCAQSMHSFSLEFSEGTTVFVKDTYSLFNALVQQSDSETIHPGDSVTLKCTASTGSCDGEPSVYWFKNSEDHHPSLIYTQSDNSDQCERKTNKKHTCVYNLSLNNLDQSNAGTYYCAVTVCGRIVFGNGTKLELKGKKCCNMSNCLMIGYIKNTFININTTSLCNFVHNYLCTFNFTFEEESVLVSGEATVKGIVYARKFLNHSWICGFYCCG